MSPENWPNRDRAAITDQRAAAQYGQYSEPMYRTTGLPGVVSAVPTKIGTVAPVVPARSHVAGVMDVKAVITESGTGVEIRAAAAAGGVACRRLTANTIVATSASATTTSSEFSFFGF